MLTEQPPLLGPPVAGEYALACEHAHSCCILLARVDKFLVGGVWHTHIDYDRFHNLVASGGLTGSVLQTRLMAVLPLDRATPCFRIFLLKLLLKPY